LAERQKGRCFDLLSLIHVLQLSNQAERRKETTASESRWQFLTAGRILKKQKAHLSEMCF